MCDQLMVIGLHVTLNTWDIGYTFDLYASQLNINILLTTNLLKEVFNAGLYIWMLVLIMVT